MSSPQRASERRLSAIGRVVLDTDLEPLALDILRRMRGIRHRTQAGAYVLIDSEKFVYLLADGSATTQVWLRRCPAMVVGLYASGAPVFPNPEQIRDDLLEHLGLRLSMIA